MAPKELHKIIKMFINNMTLIEFNWHDEEFVNDTNDIKCAIIKCTE